MAEKDLIYRKIIGVLEMGAVYTSPSSFVKKLMDSEITTDFVPDSVLIDLYKEVECMGQHYLLPEDKKITDITFAKLLYKYKNKNISLYKYCNNKGKYYLKPESSTNTIVNNISANNANSDTKCQINSDSKKTCNDNTNNNSNNTYCAKKRVRFNDTPNIVSIPARGDSQLNQERNSIIIIPAPNDERDTANTTASNMSTMAFNKIGIDTLVNLF